MSLELANERCMLCVADVNGNPGRRGDTRKRCSELSLQLTV